MVVGVTVVVVVITVVVTMVVVVVKVMFPSSMSLRTPAARGNELKPYVLGAADSEIFLSDPVE